MSEWISIDQELPIENLRVLVAYRHWNKHQLIYSVTTAYLRPSGKKMYFSQSWFGNNYQLLNTDPKPSKAGNVTHWMPLPEPPTSHTS